MHSVCDRETWAKLIAKRLFVLSSDLLDDTYKRIYTVPPEESYDKLPEWVAAEYIDVATDRRQRKAFESLISQLETLSESAVLPAFESGREKSSVLEDYISKANALIGDGKLVTMGLEKYSYNKDLKNLRAILGRWLKTPSDITDAIAEKKSEEFDKLTGYLEKKNADTEAILQEKAKLEAERSALGLFKGKRKKEIAAILETIPERIKQIEDEYELAKHSV